jgi:hypothetical protein
MMTIPLHTVNCRFVDSSLAFLLTEAIEIYPSGQIVCEYKNSEDLLLFPEQLCALNLDLANASPEEIYLRIAKVIQRHIAEVEHSFKTFSLKAREAVAIGMFTESRKRRVDAARRLIEILEVRNADYDLLGLERAPTSDDPFCKVIREYEWPFEAVIAKLLVGRPYSSNSYSQVYQLANNICEGRFWRARLLEGVSSHYELYYDGRLIFKRTEGGEPQVFETLFHEVCTPFDPEHPRSPMLISERLIDALTTMTIDGPFIDTVIANNYADESARGMLTTRFKGRSLAEALELTGIYGNIPREREVEQQEILPLAPLDQFLFRSIYWLCRGDASYSCPHREWAELQSRYPCLAESSTSSESEVGPHPAWSALQSIYHYFDGQPEGSLPPFNRENAEGLLTIAKMFDRALEQINLRRPIGKIAFDRGTDELRQRLVEIDPTLLSVAVFTKGLKPCNFTTREGALYLSDPGNFIPSRVALQARIAINLFVEARALANRPPVLGKIIAVRGGTAVGKSSALPKGRGILNVDSLKWAVRKQTIITNMQLHDEISSLFKRIFADVDNNRELYFVVDMRLKAMEEISHYVLEPAKKRNCTAELYDYDAPLVTSFNRVLNRDPNGADPIPTMEAITSAFIAIRRSRSAHVNSRGQQVEGVIDAMRCCKLVDTYALHYLGKLVAEKQNDHWIVHNQADYDECVRVPTDSEIDELFDRPIDDNYIAEAIERRDFRSPDDTYRALTRWRGYTVRAALGMHAQGLSPTSKKD